MKQETSSKKRMYSRPVVRKINLDNVVSLYMMSEGTIPDPPWVENKTGKTDPYKTDKA